MQVGDILRKKAARVATVRMNETVAIAAQLMRSSNISALVVKDVVRTEGNTAVGMFTERDVVRAIAEHGAAGVNMRVSQFISVQQLVSCTSTDTLEHVRHLMSKHHIRHVPVIDNYSLIGVVSIRDIFNRVRRRSNALQAGRVGLTGRSNRAGIFGVHSQGRRHRTAIFGLTPVAKQALAKLRRSGRRAGKHHLCEGAWRVTF